MPVLMLTCEKCRSEGEYPTSRYGGNDPDVTMRHCTKCDGFGEVVRYCEACNTPATDQFPDGTYWCDEHTAEMRAEAVEERLAAMTSWGREMVAHNMRLWLAGTIPDAEDARRPTARPEAVTAAAELTEDGLADWLALPRSEQERLAKMEDEA